MKSRYTGFTFVELILVVAMLFTLGTLSAVFYSRFFTQNAVANTSDQLANQLRKAQVYALSGKQNSSWGVRFASNTLTLFATASAALNENTSIPSSVSVTGFTQVIFTKPSGLPDSTPTITITDNRGNTDTVGINAQGILSRN